MKVGFVALWSGGTIWERTSTLDPRAARLFAKESIPEKSLKAAVKKSARSSSILVFYSFMSYLIDRIVLYKHVKMAEARLRELAPAVTDKITQPSLGIFWPVCSSHFSLLHYYRVSDPWIKSGDHTVPWFIALLWLRPRAESDNHAICERLRGHPYMTSTKFWDFLTPPCPHLGRIYSTKFTQPPLPHLLLG